MNLDKHLSNLDQAVHISYSGGFTETSYRIVPKKVQNFLIFERVIPAHVEYTYWDGLTRIEGSVREWQRNNKDRYVIIHGVILEKPTITIQFSDKSTKNLRYNRVDEAEEMYKKICNVFNNSISHN